MLFVLFEKRKYFKLLKIFFSVHSPEDTPKGVLNRVGHSQTKWQRQVKEQRKNIYDNHTMLN